MMSIMWTDNMCTVGPMLQQLWLLLTSMVPMPQHMSYSILQIVQYIKIPYYGTKNNKCDDWKIKMDKGCLLMAINRDIMCATFQCETFWFINIKWGDPHK